MPRWTVVESDKWREKILLTLEKEGGTIARKSETMRYLAEKSGFPNYNTLTGFLGRMERDGLIVMTPSPATANSAKKYWFGVSLAEAKKEEEVVEPTRDDEKMEAASLPGPEVVAPPPVEGVPLANLEARVILMEERARLVIAEAETAMEVIAFLKDPPPEFDATGPIRAERDYLQKQVNELQRKLKDREMEASTATNRLAGTTVRLNAEKDRGDALEKNMRAMLNNRTKSGITIREALEPRASKEIERLMRNTPTRKG